VIDASSQRLATKRIPSPELRHASELTASGLLRGRTQAIDTHRGLKGSRRKIGGSAQEGRASDQGLRPIHFPRVTISYQDLTRRRPPAGTYLYVAAPRTCTSTAWTFRRSDEDNVFRTFAASVSIGERRIWILLGAFVFSRGRGAFSSRWPAESVCQ
jgi:hypothetical protein